MLAIFVTAFALYWAWLIFSFIYDLLHARAVKREAELVARINAAIEARQLENIKVAIAQAARPGGVLYRSQKDRTNDR